VNTEFEQILLPELPPGSVIVLGNPRLRQSPTTRQLAKRAGCQRLFLALLAPSNTSGPLQDPPTQKIATAANTFIFKANMSQPYCELL
jgi:hypothetical protein